MTRHLNMELQQKVWQAFLDTPAEKRTAVGIAITLTGEPNPRIIEYHRALSTSQRYLGWLIKEGKIKKDKLTRGFAYSIREPNTGIAAHASLTSKVTDNSLEAKP